MAAILVLINAPVRIVGKRHLSAEVGCALVLNSHSDGYYNGELRTNEGRGTLQWSSGDFKLTFARVSGDANAASGE